MTIEFDKDIGGWYGGPFIYVYKVFHNYKYYCKIYLEDIEKDRIRFSSSYKNRELKVFTFVLVNIISEGGVII